MKKVLIECFFSLLKECERKNKLDEEYNDEAVLGVVNFMQEVATKTGSIELLGILGRFELLYKQKEEAEEEVWRLWEEERNREAEQEFSFCDDIHKLCKEVLFKGDGMSVDMAKYRDILEENKVLLRKWGGYERLQRYIDEENVLMKVYDNVRGRLYSRRVAPSEDDVLDEYRFQVTEIYRKADMYLASQLAKAKAELGKA